MRPQPLRKPTILAWLQLRTRLVPPDTLGDVVAWLRTRLVTAGAPFLRRPTATIEILRARSAQCVAGAIRRFLHSPAYGRAAWNQAKIFAGQGLECLSRSGEQFGWCWQHNVPTTALTLKSLSRKQERDVIAQGYARSRTPNPEPRTPNHRHPAAVNASLCAAKS
jgi:hypothetical protein